VTKRSKPDPQVERFRKAAKELGCDESEKAFDAALKRVASSPPPKQADKPKKKEKPAK
jgi:hypothetical protein